MTINTIICYQTEDGKIWQTLAQAEFWEKLLSNENPFKKERSEKEEPQYNFRNEGENDFIDRYAGRGVWVW